MTSGYVCTSCGAACAADTHEPKCRCGGLFELDFTPPAWDPARIDRSEWSIFRYRDFMAVDGDIWRSVTMGEGMTPVIEMDGRNGVLLKMATPSRPTRPAPGSHARSTYPKARAPRRSR